MFNIQVTLKSVEIKNGSNAWMTKTFKTFVLSQVIECTPSVHAWSFKATTHNSVVVKYFEKVYIWLSPVASAFTTFEKKSIKDKFKLH